MRWMFRSLVCVVVLCTGLALSGCRQTVSEPRLVDTTRILPDFADGEVDLPEGKLHYVSGGTGPVIILLHGFPEDWSAWRHIAPLLADQFMVIMPDLRGLGGSTTT